jgi:hypothetical protein
MDAGRSLIADRHRAATQVAGQRPSASAPSREESAGGAQVLAGLDDAGGHAGLGLLAPGARVVLLLVADLAVDLEDAVVVLEHPVATGRVKAYWVSVSTFIFTTP